MNVKIPTDIAPGDYLCKHYNNFHQLPVSSRKCFHTVNLGPDVPVPLQSIDRWLTPANKVRAEALALHTASSSGGAQFYMTCFQITVSGSGSASPATVKLPGAYAASDPGILVDIHAAMSTYVNPGPTVYSGGSTKSAGAACAGCESTCAATSGPSGTAAVPSTTAAPTTLSTSSKTSASASTTSASGGGTNCAAKYAQCGGSGWTGATCCVSGSTCSATNQVIISIH